MFQRLVAIALLTLTGCFESRTAILVEGTFVSGLEAEYSLVVKVPPDKDLPRSSARISYIPDEKPDLIQHSYLLEMKFPNTEPTSVPFLLKKSAVPDREIFLIQYSKETDQHIIGLMEISQGDIYLYVFGRDPEVYGETYFPDIFRKHEVTLSENQKYPDLHFPISVINGTKLQVTAALEEAALVWAEVDLTKYPKVVLSPK